MPASIAGIFMLIHIAAASQIALGKNHQQASVISQQVGRVQPYFSAWKPNSVR